MQLLLMFKLTMVVFLNNPVDCAIECTSENDRKWGSNRERSALQYIL